MKKGAAIAILTAVLSPLVVSFSIWASSAISTNKVDIRENKTRIESMKEILLQIHDSQKTQEADIKTLLQR